jgi:hypothetical protein
MASNRLLELTALAMIGEGVIGVAYPEKHLRLWNVGPQRLRSLVAALAAHPRLMRLTFGAEALAGLWLAQRELKSGEATPDEAGRSLTSEPAETPRAEPDAEEGGRVAAEASA